MIWDGCYFAKDIIACSECSPLLIFVYPKVKVKEQVEDDEYAVRDPKKTSCSLVNKCEDDSTVPFPKIPRSCKPRAVVSTIAVPKGNKEQKVVQNVKAGSILRPRAVLSSPDNDRMIGKTNMIRTEQPSPSPLKNHNLVQSRHALCKIVPSPIESDILSEVVSANPRSTRRKTKEQAGENHSNPVTTRRFKEEARDRKCDLKSKKGPTPVVPNCKKETELCENLSTS